MRRACASVSALALVIATGCHVPSMGRVPRQTVATAAGLSPAICAEDLRTDVVFLASDECEGRLTGSPGATRASQYIATVLKNAGALPLGDDDSYYQPFKYAAGVQQVSGANRMEILTFPGAEVTTPCKLDVDFRPLTFSGNGRAEGGVVFVGYGLVEPASTGTGYDSYAGLDVSGKVVLALRDLPEELSPERRQELALYAGDRYKAKLAADRGAKAFLLVVGPNSPNPGVLMKFRTGDRTASVPILAASVSHATADRLLSPADVDLEALQTTLDESEVGTLPKAVAAGYVRIDVQLERVWKTCRNVIGVLPPIGGSDEYVLVGAHYDHIGHGEGLGSLAKEGEKGLIHNGADDNASGTAVVLETGAAIAESRRLADPAAPRRGVILACWSGEELGLVGSSYFVNHPLVPLDKIAAYLNFDMVGRLRDNKLIMQGVGSSPAWPRLIERHNTGVPFDLTLNDDPYLPTDSTVFYTKGVPGLSWFTDLHEDYNRPTDDADTLDYEGMLRITKLAKALIQDAADPGFEIAYAKIQRAAPAGGRMRMRTYTGIVPDFAAGDVEGVKLADVRAGGPAANAGLKGGDVIIEFAGKKITGLQDYMYALTAAKVDQPVPVVVIRDGNRITLTVTPAARGE